MRKILLTLIFLTALGTTVWAQSDSRISAILNKEPAYKAAELNANAEATAALGESGIVNMLAMLQPNGAADNTKIYDALTGFSFYVTQPGKELGRATAARAYCKALAKDTDKYNQAFIISQLQIVGRDDAVSTLKKYLADKRLCDPAARALVKINTLAAKAALRQALPASQDSCQLSIVEALGDSKDALAVKSIIAQVGKDKKRDKVVLYALANIASPLSATLMQNAAQKAGYTYDVTNATSSYLLYIRNLGRKGNKETAVRLAKSVINKTRSAGQVQTRIAALKIVVDLQGAASTPFLVKESRNYFPAEDTTNEYQYNMEAVRFGAAHLTPETTALWIKELSNAYVEDFDGIIKMFADHHVQAAYPAILKLTLTSNHAWVSEEALIALMKIGQERSLDRIFQLPFENDPEFNGRIKSALLTMKGKDVVDRVAKELQDIDGYNKVILIEVLAAKRAHRYIDVVTPLLKSNDTAVRAAAYGSLDQLAGAENLDQLFGLLASSDKPSETANVQSAIMSVVGHAKDKSAQSTAVLAQMNQQSSDKKTRYFNILAAIGDKPSLKAVSAAYDKGDGATQKAAVMALSQWANTSAGPELLSISKNATNAGLHDQALRGFVAMISKSDYPADEKVIYLRDAMEVAQTTSQKQLILEEVTNNKTFPALVFVSQYLDDPKLQGDAADDVSNIALSDKNIYGADVKLWLTKAIQIKKGGDADYEKVAIRKFIAEMPSDAGLVPLFNNYDLTGWKGLVGNPIIRSKMDAQTLAKEQQHADSVMHKGWYVKDSVLNFSGDGENICTTKQYRNFEMYVDWKIEAKGDAGIYLRGSPQVQIWDTSRVDVGAQVGSGGLYNNQAHESKPSKLADNAINDWNNFHIIMKDDKVTVYLNGVLVVDNVVMDNYWDRKLPIFPKEQIELQAHGTHVYYRDIYLRELPD